MSWSESATRARSFCITRSRNCCRASRAERREHLSRTKPLRRVALRAIQIKPPTNRPVLQHLVAITTPSGLVVRFLTTSLETASAAALAAHLVSPLLGVCSGLLSLLREHSDDDSALCRRIEGAIDASGNAERIRDGRSAETFAKVGGPALLGRWIQRSTGARDKDVRTPRSLRSPLVSETDTS